MRIYQYFRQFWQRFIHKSSSPQAAPSAPQQNEEPTGLAYRSLAQRAKAQADGTGPTAPLQTYRYCGVIFPKANWVYHYRTTDTTIAVGDLVLVPVFVHRELQEATGIVVSTGDHLELSVPYPLNETSFIIRKL